MNMIKVKMLLGRRPPLRLLVSLGRLAGPVAVVASFL